MYSHIDRYGMKGIAVSLGARLPPEASEPPHRLRRLRGPLRAGLGQGLAAASAARGGRRAAL